jgi:pyruvate,water dikinase
MMNKRTYTLNFVDIDKSMLAIVGGKGAGLGELARIEDVNVPEGFCITTDVYKEIFEDNEKLRTLLDQLANLKAHDRKGISATSTQIRSMIEAVAIPKHINDEIVRCFEQLGENDAYAVRSSATAEDLPTASFAGQQDTYLNVKGKEAILKYISRCWASMFSDRAVTYRLQNGFDHRKVYLSVVIQKMIIPEVSGIMFTADPVSSNRKVLSIDASFGLGDALVSGIVNADNYKVRDGTVVDKKISAKKLAVYPLEPGGTKQHVIDAARKNTQALTKEQILELERIGRKIEKHFGSPQDIEWCLVYNASDRLDRPESFSDRIYIVQSRPITTLFPIPEANDLNPDDLRNHVYLSVGHQQMMTDAMKPLGLSLWQLSAVRPMHKAGGRLFVDVSQELSTPHGRNGLLRAMGQHDPLIKDALETIIERGEFITTLLNDGKNHETDVRNKTTQTKPQIENDPSIISELIRSSEKSLAVVKENIQSKSGLDLFECIEKDMPGFRKSLIDSRSMGVLMTAINASVWVNEKMNEWLGEKNVADTLSQSVSNNITSEMGRELLDVADIVRSYPKVIEFLQDTKADNFLDELPRFEGGKLVQISIIKYLEKYGMRCSGEIDITKARWSEKPSILIPMILSHIKNFKPVESKRKFEQGQHEARKKEQELVDRLVLLPDGEQKVKETKRMIGLIRNFSGYREYPKYAMVSRYFVYKQGLLKEAQALVQGNVINEEEDVYYLTFKEFREAVATKKVDHQIIDKRKEEYKLFEKLTPPRVITSDGEIITGKYKREGLPADAIAGLAVSSGIIEGRARVILNMEDADMEEGDILVTSFTDPSWTPLFVSIKGLVTEVGGLMTHGAVIAREYGLPAVVGVENATKLIKEGQRIRVHGTEGYVEIL